MKNLFLFFLLEFPASLKIVAKKGGWLIDRYHQQTHRKKKENRMTSWYIHSAGECYPHLFAINHGNSTSNNIPRIYMQRDANTTVSEIIENLLWKCSYLCSEASLEIAHPYKSLPHVSQTGFSASDSGFLICFCICGKSISSTSLSAFDASASSSWLKTVPFRYQLAISLHLQDTWSY